VDSYRTQYEALGYQIEAAPPESWRKFDASDPSPGYFEFDWLSARHPDLYHRFALSTTGLMDELRKLVDFTGLTVCDVGAGTGRSAIGAAESATHVIAVDAFASVVRFGRDAARRAGRTNVSYVQGDRSYLPLRDESVDAVTCAWAELDFEEAFRVLRDGGWVILMACPMPGGLGGELAPVLAVDFPDLVTEVGLSEWWDPHCPPVDFVEPSAAWSDVLPKDARVKDGVVHGHDFTYVAQYESATDLVEIVARLYGPRAKEYVVNRGGSTLTSRGRISYFRIAK
jgi:SAM-dependent methyltransferase